MIEIIFWLAYNEGHQVAIQCMEGIYLCRVPQYNY
jgi:hypothetical protein